MIYVITAGAYSEYHVVAATTNRERAIEIRDWYIAEYGGWYYATDCKIEAYEDGLKTPPLWWEVVIYNDGRAKATEYCDDEVYIDQSGDMLTYGYIVDVNAETEEEAIKIASEKRAMYLAEKEGIA